jgi:membrane protease YdiL (CAAX protease family)
MASVREWLKRADRESIETFAGADSDKSWVHRAALPGAAMAVTALTYLLVSPRVRVWLSPLVADLPRGPKLFFSHLLLWTTAWAVVCAACLVFLANRRILKTPVIGPVRHALLQGTIAALVVSAITIATWLAVGQGLMFEIDLWKMGGNLFSNAYEELAYRGVFFGAAFIVFRRVWAAALISGFAFAYTHDQFPLEFRIMTGLIGFYWAFVYARARSLLAAYVAHQLSDMILDAVLKT